MAVSSSSSCVAESSTPTATAPPAPSAPDDRSAIDHALAVVCDRELDLLAAASPAVADAVRYSLLGGGKRLRGVLVLRSYRAAGGRGDASGLAAAVEVVHAYSLVHDDLPCMDDDDLRRGRPTVHRVFGVRAATVAGVAMVPLAVRAALAGAARLELAEAAACKIVAELMIASGGGGMIGGQLLDLQGEGLALTLPDMQRIHGAKTGALIAASAALGALAACAPQPVIAAFREFGGAVGLAFQIADDVLDVTATSDVLGKTAGRDAALRKGTYPALLGVDAARRRAAAFVEQGCAALAAQGLLTADLQQLAQFAVDRQS